VKNLEPAKGCPEVEFTILEIRNLQNELPAMVCNYRIRNYYYLLISRFYLIRQEPLGSKFLGNVNRDSHERVVRG